MVGAILVNLRFSHNLDSELWAVAEPRGRLPIKISGSLGIRFKPPQCHNKESDGLSFALKLVEIVKTGNACTKHIFIGIAVRKLSMYINDCRLPLILPGGSRYQI